MRRETRDLLARTADRDLEAVTKRAAERARARAALLPPGPAVAVTLPLEQTRLFTMTETELHDATYHAVSVYLSTLSQMTKTKAHEHAGRIAAAAVRAALVSDYLHIGADPRC